MLMKKKKAKNRDSQGRFLLSPLFDSLGNKLMARNH